jgi:hypothetical protein
MNNKNRAPSGVCRFCGCTETTPCSALRTGECCAWADRTQTFCTNPKCLAKDVRRALASRFREGAGSVKAFDNLKNHMTAATMNDGWETLAEIIAWMRRDCGLQLTRVDVITYLQELAKDGTCTLASRFREGADNVREFRLNVKEIEAMQEYLVKPRRSR